MNIKSLDDVKEARHSIKFMYWNKEDTDICTHKDDSYYRHFKNLNEAKKHFTNLGFNLEKNNQYIAPTGCIVEEYFIEKIREKEYEIN